MRSLFDVARYAPLLAVLLVAACVSSARDRSHMPARTAPDAPDPYARARMPRYGPAPYRRAEYRVPPVTVAEPDPNASVRRAEYGAPALAEPLPAATVRHAEYERPPTRIGTPMRSIPRARTTDLPAAPRAPMSTAPETPPGTSKPMTIDEYVEELLRTGR